MLTLVGSRWRPSLIRRHRVFSNHAESRLAKWEAEKARQEQAAAQAVSVELVLPTLTAPFAVTATTPLHAMAQYVQHTGEKIFPVVGASITTRENPHQSQVWDLSRALPSDAHHVRLHSFDDDSMKSLFWHSSAHVLGAALEAKFGDDVLLTDGPAQQDGFFYEMYLEKQRTLSEADFADIESHMTRLIKQKAPFERMEVTRDVARDLFAYSKFKCQMLDNIPSTEAVTLYRCGTFVDLCRGPHLPHTGKNMHVPGIMHVVIPGITWRHGAASRVVDAALWLGHSYNIPVLANNSSISQ